MPVRSRLHLQPEHKTRAGQHQNPRGIEDRVNTFQVKDAKVSFVEVQEPVKTLSLTGHIHQLIDTTGEGRQHYRQDYNRCQKAVDLA